MHRHGTLALLLILGASLAACREDDPSREITAPPSLIRAAATSARPAGSPRLLPWAAMSDDSLAKRVAEVHGQVVIGIREPGGPAAVDENGTVRVSAATLNIAKAWLRSNGVGIKREYKFIPAVEATIPSELVTTLRRNAMVEYVEPVEPLRPTAQDTSWNVFRVDAPAAWPSAKGSAVKVLVVGTGMQTHSDVSPAVIQGCDGTNGVDSVTTGLDAGHETMVAGVIAALDNTSGVIGIAPSVSLWSSKTKTNSDAACSMEFAMTNHLFAVNMSFETSPLTALTDDINIAYADSGILIVASAGNDASASVAYPANLAAVMAVGATDLNDGKAYFTNWGTGLELVAPGVNISTTCPGSTICAVNGTSFSAPAVTAAAAVLKSYNSAWSNFDIRARIDSAADDLGSTSYFGFGMLDVYGAMTYTYPTPPTVSIDGPTRIRPGATCIWSAVASGGTTPYTYDWHIDGIDMGSDSVLETAKPVGLGSPFTVYLDVRTADGALGSTSISVTESSTATICPN